MFGIWYNNKFSMDVAETTEYNSSANKNKLLIATQESEFKNQLTKAIVNDLLDSSLYIKVIDLTKLSSETKEFYNACLIIHTWEAWKVPEPVSQYIQSQSNLKTFYIGTSGSGELILPEVDAVSSASNIDEITSHLSKLNLWLTSNKVFN